MRNSALVAAIGFICIAVPAQAQHEKGDVSLLGSGTISFRTGDDSTSSSAFGSINLGFGKFVAKNTEIGLQTSLWFAASGEDSGGTDFDGTVGLSAKQYFGADRTRLYVGGLVETSVQTGLDERPFYFRAAAGVRRYLNRNSSVFAELNYGINVTGGDVGFDDLPTLYFGFAMVI